MPRRKHKRKTTHLVLVVGLILQQGIALGTELGAIFGLGHNRWYAAGMAIAGIALTFLSASGYNRARAAVELTQLAGLEPELAPAKAPAP